MRLHDTAIDRPDRIDERRTHAVVEEERAHPLDVRHLLIGIDRPRVRYPENNLQPACLCGGNERVEARQRRVAVRRVRCEAWLHFAPGHQQHDAVESISRDLGELAVDAVELDGTQVVDGPAVPRQAEIVGRPDDAVSDATPSRDRRLRQRDQDDRQRRDDDPTHGPHH